VISEATVIAVASALYLFDCIVLLERGQALVEARGSRLALQFGSAHYQVSGKAVALMNPLTPFCIVLRTAPLFESGPGPKTSRALRLLAPLRTAALLQFLLVFAILPWCLYRAPGWPFVIALLLAYLNAAAMLAFIAWRYGRLGVSRRPLWGLGFGWLACLPLSVNSLRRAGIAFQLPFDARAAMRLLPADGRAVPAAGLAAQVEEALHDLDEGDAERNRLAALKQELEGVHGRV
jgi:hypothetical protein